MTQWACSSARLQNSTGLGLAIEHAGLLFTVLDENVEKASGHVSISTMYLAKGLSSAPLP